MSNVNCQLSNVRSGFATLISILLVGAIGLAIAVSLLLLGISASRTSFARVQSYQAKSLADACAEEALQRIRDSSSYTGAYEFALGRGVCAFAVTSQGGQNRTIQATGVVGSMTRRVRVIIDQINPTMRTTSWEEVADF